MSECRRIVRGAADWVFCFLCECFDIQRHNVQCTCQSMSPESSLSQLTCGTRIACIATLTNRKHHRQHSISLEIDSWTTVDILYFVVIFVHDTINKLNEFTGNSIVTERRFQRQQKKINICVCCGIEKWRGETRKITQKTHFGLRRPTVQYNSAHASPWYAGVRHVA